MKTTYQVQVLTDDGEWVQAGPASIATLKDAELERALLVEEGEDVGGCDFDREPIHNGSRIVEAADDDTADEDTCSICGAYTHEPCGDCHGESK